MGLLNKNKKEKFDKYEIDMSFLCLFPSSKWLLFSAALTTTQDENTMYSTEATLNLQLAPTPATQSMWPHWGWGVLLSVALLMLGLLGVICCFKR